MRLASRPLLAACTAVAFSLAVAACAAPASTTVTPAATAAADAVETANRPAESAARTPRIVLAYDGGLLVLDAHSLAEEARIDLEGFARLNPAGDGRHVAVSTSGAFRILDAGTWTQAHGDHVHYVTQAPALTDLAIEAQMPGHVVVHDGLAAFFDDGTGEVTVVEAAGWEHMVQEGHLDVVRSYTAAAPHHGVAVASEGGALLVTLGTEEARDGAMVLGGDDAVVASSDQCPGVHGETAFETAAGGEMFALGCEDGVLIFHGDRAHKVVAADAFGRTGNLFAVDGNDIVLGDYKTNTEGGIGLSEIVLIDSEAASSLVVDPFAGSGARYTWQGLERGEDGEVLVFGTDGALRVIDPETGAVVRSIDVTAAWDVPEEWQTPHPNVVVLDGMGYVTEPATGTVHIVDYVGGEVWKSVDVGVEAREMVGVTG